MKSIIRNLSVPTEFCLIIFICFGLTFAASLIWIINQFYHVPQTPGVGIELLTNQRIVEAVLFQVLTLSLALWIGSIRGWSLAAFGLRPSWKWTGVGVLLFSTSFLIQLVVVLVTARIFHGAVDFHRVSRLTIPFIFLISIANPVFEETIESGYFFYALQRHGMWLTILSAAIFRGFLHVTMGSSGFIAMFIQGLIFGFFYWRWRQLWPLIVAHSLQMLYSLLRHALNN